MTERLDIVIAETTLAIIAASLVMVLVLGYMGPPRLQEMVEPVIQLLITNMIGFQVWQFVTIAILAIGSWLIIVDMRRSKQL